MVRVNPSPSPSCVAGVCMYVKIRQHQHTRVHAHTSPRRHTTAPACHRHHIPRLVRRQAFHTDHHRRVVVGAGPTGGNYIYVTCNN